jgi:predicted PurR-regulated permease PerM
MNGVKPVPPDAESWALSAPMNVRSVALIVIAVVAVIVMLQYAESMIIPIVLAVLISYALDPVVAWLTRWHLPRPVAAAILLMILVGTSGALIYGLRYQANEIVEQLPQGARRLRRMLERDRPAQTSAMQQVQKAATELEKAASAAAATAAPSGVQRVQVEAAPINISSYIMLGSLGIAAIFGQIVMVLFLVFFLLASGDLYRRKIVKIAGPSLAKKKITLQILEEIDRQIAMFLLVQLFTSIVVAVGTWLAFRSLGVQQAATWGILAGLFNSIPYFGPVLVSGGTAAVAFLQFGTIRMAVIVGGVALVITTLEGFLLTPWLTSRAARMNAVAIFVGLLFWGWIWDIWGMLLAVPMLMVMKVVCDHIEELNGVGELLGD